MRVVRFAYTVEDTISILIIMLFLLMLGTLLLGPFVDSVSYPVAIAGYGSMIILVILAGTWLLLRRVWIMKVLKGRQGFPVMPHIPVALQTSALNDKYNHVDVLRLLSGTDDYRVYHAVFSSDSDSKRANMYTIFEGELRRQVPHLFFDSKKARGLQFRAYFMQGQRIRLEANFDKYFRLYAPDYYQIDTLSFITPEVMEAFIRLSRYDIELVENIVYIFGPLMDDESMDVFTQDAQYLHKHLLDNLDTYRDTRIGSHGLRNTTYLGRQLLRSYTIPLVLVTISAAVFFPLIIWLWTIDFRYAFNVYTILFGAELVASAVSVLRIRRKNAKIKEAYRYEINRANN